MSEDIFATLKEDHETHRKLLDKMAETSGETERRKELLEAVHQGSEKPCCGRGAGAVFHHAAQAADDR